MIELLIKMADSLDMRGFHEEASRVDVLIKKIATTLEYESNFVKECAGCGNHADDEDSVDDLMDDVEDFASYTDDYEAINKAYDDLLKKKKRKKKRGWGG